MSTLTPIISVLMICTFTSLMFIGMRKSMVKELNFCVDEISKIQVEHRKLTIRLLALNTQARWLRRARKAAKVAYTVAIIPHVKAAARLALESAKYSQKILRGYQLSLIARAYALSGAMISRMVSKSYIPLKPPTGLQVKKIHPRSDSPEYVLKKNYTKKKKIRFFKRYSLFRDTPKKLLKFIGIKDTYKNFNCGSTLLEKEEKPWKVKLILDK